MNGFWFVDVHFIAVIILVSGSTTNFVLLYETSKKGEKISKRNLIISIIWLFLFGTIALVANHF